MYIILLCILKSEICLFIGECRDFLVGLMLLLTMYIILHVRNDNTNIIITPIVKKKKKTL